MEIKGLNKTTLLDYPGHVAATVFTGGCNFRCPYCHNSDLVLSPGLVQGISPQELGKFLEKRRAVLQGICITGGEPTLQPDLAEFICWVKGYGYLVKLDTNGYRPEVLHRLLEKELLDYVAMDIKAFKDNYDRAVGWEDMCANTGGTAREMRPFDITPIEESVQLLMNCGIPYEFRTTVVQGIHTVEEFEGIGRWLAGARAYYLQAYRENENELKRVADIGCRKEQILPVFSTFSKGEMEQMQEILQKYIPVVGLRGLD